MAAGWVGWGSELRTGAMRASAGNETWALEVGVALRRGGERTHPELLSQTACNRLREEPRGTARVRGVPAHGVRGCGVRVLLPGHAAALLFCGKITAAGLAGVWGVNMEDRRARRRGSAGLGAHVAELALDVG